MLLHIFLINKFVPNYYIGSNRLASTKLENLVHWNNTEEHILVQLGLIRGSTCSFKNIIYRKSTTKMTIN